MNLHPANVDDNDPLVVRDFGDAANAGFARLYPDRRPMLLKKTKLVELPYSPTAPMVHEGGAMYPLDRFVGGFGVRVPQRTVPLSHREALRFTFDGPGAFEVPIWGLPDTAGPAEIVLALAHDPNGAAVAVSLDGVMIANAIATTGPEGVVQHRVRAFLVPGQHWLGITAATARRGQVVIVDEVTIQRPTNAR
jgi:hypothetical protein